jgi:hypothetical protein
MLPVEPPCAKSRGAETQSSTLINSLQNFILEFAPEFFIFSERLPQVK